MPTMLRVHRTTWLADRVTQVELRDPEGKPLPGWEPGAHLSLHLPNGLVREYSLCGDPADTHAWTVAVLREESSRGGSAWVHERLTAGSVLPVEGPRNTFELHDAPEHLLIAGGIGVTPILAMARKLANDSAPWSMLYCGRSRAGMAFLDELSGLGGDRLEVHADDEHGGPPDLAARLAGLAPGTVVHCCGPEPLLRAVEAALPETAALRVERFRAPEAPAAAPGTGFDVVCAGSGTRVSVAADESIVDALGRTGISVPTSCREGVCGTCETKVLSGEPDHRDFVLDDDEKAIAGTMMLCVSRCRSAELVLDL
ncbi:PDR/VanB family oxidoreductase [Amycolatopsis sp. NPDC004079]|uniref:PDR/VanB family oxidoreductase n=1 Tax=Amycolatopsis sp. NPDC004079 TaxID=3154549 RepID=UPI0033B8F989